MTALQLHQLQKILHIGAAASDEGIMSYNAPKSLRQSGQSARILRECSYGDRSGQRLHRHEEIVECNAKTGDPASGHILFQFHPAHVPIKAHGLLRPFLDILHEHFFHIIDADHLGCPQIKHDILQKICNLPFHPGMFLQIRLDIPCGVGIHFHIKQRRQTQKDPKRKKGYCGMRRKCQQLILCGRPAETESQNQPYGRPHIQQTAQQGLIQVHHRSDSSVHIRYPL